MLSFVVMIVPGILGSMAAALRRLVATQERVESSNPALAAFKISGKKGWMAAFSTHPLLEVRIAALEQGR